MKKYVLREGKGIMRTFADLETARERFKYVSLISFEPVELYEITENAETFTLLEVRNGQMLDDLLAMQDLLDKVIDQVQSE